MQEEHCEASYFLLLGDAVLSIKHGEVIDGTYRLENVRGTQLTLRYLPLNQQQTLEMGAEAPVGAAASAVVSANAGSGVADLRGPGSSSMQGDVALSWSGPSYGRVGQEVAITLAADAINPMGALAITLGYDPNAISIERIEEGLLLKQDGATTRFTKLIDDASGQATIQVERAAGDGTTGRGDILSIVLKGKVRIPTTGLAALTLAATGPAGRPMSIAGMSPYALEIRASHD